MSKTVAIIPARSGSKGVKNKNIKKLLGHTLLEWTVRAAQCSKLIDRVFVSTDSSKYAKLAKRYGAEAPFLRPKKISSDRSSDYDFIVHAIEEFAKNDIYPEYIVQIRPTTPFRDPKKIDEAIKLIKKNTNYNSLRSVHIMSESSYKTFEIIKGNLTPLSLFNNKKIDTNAARQSFPDTYQANGYVDILSLNFIKKNKEIHGKKILPFITDFAYELDTNEDFKKLELIAAQSQSIFLKLFR